MASNTQITLQSDNADFSEDGHRKILMDLRNIAQAVNANSKPAANQPASYGGGPTANVPVAGLAKVFLTPNASFVASSLGYYTISCIINGVPKAGISIVTNTQSITAYKQLYLGSAQVSQGSMVETQVVATGAPATTLTSANFSVRVDLSPGATS